MCRLRTGCSEFQARPAREGYGNPKNCDKRFDACFPIGFRFVELQYVLGALTNYKRFYKRSYVRLGSSTLGPTSVLGRQQSSHKDFDILETIGCPVDG